jgi:RND family efflux transporter MFP subunit
MGAQARFDQAGINLGYTEVRAPISGMVSRRLVDLGNLVGASEATVLTTVTRMDPMYVFFNAPERYVLQALRDQDEDDVQRTEASDTLLVEVGTAIDDDYPFTGYVDFVNNTVDAATGTIEIRAVVANEGVKLFPGLFVRVRVAGAVRENAILVHEVAIGTDLGGKYVLIVDSENVVDRKYVKLGPVQDDGKVVVEEGLEGNERYILGGLLRARPGFPVNATDAEGS